jgi:hypothetical protein
MNNSPKIVTLEHSSNKNSKKINYEKEKKMRVETKRWGLTENELHTEIQLKTLYLINDKNYDKDFGKDLGKDLEKDKYYSTIINHIKTKITSYKQQDILKKKLDESNFVSFNEVIKLLQDCLLKCHYCSEDIFILYERVREMKQWTLDRIDNDKGHITGNVLIACLECNLKRRRTNKDAFMFTKNLVITREGL